MKTFLKRPIILALFTTAFLLFCVPDTVLAQEEKAYPKSSFGIRAGANLNSWTNEFPYIVIDDNLIFPDDWSATVGFHVSGYVNIRLSDLVAIEPGLAFTTKGTGMVINNSDVSAEGIIASAYMDLPVLLRLYVSNGFNLFLGPQFSYQITSTYTLKINGEKIIDNEDGTDLVSELDFAPVFGMGYEFDSGFNINLAGEFGLSTTDRFGELSTYNRTIRFSLGYTFKK